MVTSEIHKAFDYNIQMDGILLDLSKAFDKVSHTRLALKLEHYGVRGNNLRWIQCFLSDRIQKVVLNGKQSEMIPVTSGVPQGTILRPLLFLVHINDLPDKVRYSTACLLADDCLLYCNVKRPQDLHSLQEDLNSLQAWEKDWQMAFNPSKCQTIHFTRKRPMILDYTIRDHVLETDESTTYLGAKLHATASWSPHCSTTSKKAECTRAFLQRNLASTPHPIKKQCYTTLLRQILEYASAVWDPHCQSDIQKLERPQRRYARLTVATCSRENTVTEMLQTLGWDTLAERRAKSGAIMTYRIRHDLIDIPLDQHFTQLTTS